VRKRLVGRQIIGHLAGWAAARRSGGTTHLARDQGVAVIPHETLDVGERSRDRGDARVEHGTVSCRPHGGIGVQAWPLAGPLAAGLHCLTLGGPVAQQDLSGRILKAPRS
jgi:hypothetical protein